MKPDRLRHTYAVRDAGLRLAEKYGADKNKVAQACLFHDIAKGNQFTEDVMNGLVREFDLEDKYIGNSALAHSQVAAKLMERDWSITDDEVINAVRYHTVGRADMTLIEQIVFIADAIEDGREYDGADELRKLAFENLDKACYVCMNNTIIHVLNNHQYLDVDSVIARNHYMEKEKSKEKLNEKQRDGNVGG